MKLVVSETCPFCHRCSLVLLEKGAPCDIERVDLTRKQEFRELLSPYAYVPVLWHEGRPIYESSIINEYLEETFPTPPLLPREPHRKAMARFWIDFCDTRFMPAYFNLLKERNPALRGPLRAKLLDHLRFIETTGLADVSTAGPYWMGREATLVDLAFYPFFERFASVEAYRGVTVPADHDRLHGWLAAMGARAAVRKLARPRDFYVDHFRPYYADG